MGDAGLPPQDMNGLNPRVRKQSFQNRTPDEASGAGQSNRSFDGLIAGLSKSHVHSPHAPFQGLPEL